MSKKNETAGKTARHGARCAAHRKTTPKRITLTIDGERYAALERVAEALNGIPWCCSDNTAESVFREWVWPFADDPTRNPREWCGLVEGSFDTGYADGTPEDRARIAEVRAAFEAAGLYDDPAERRRNGHRGVCA